MPSNYSTDVLTGVVASLVKRQVPRFFRDTFFGAVQQSEQENISFDVDTGRRRVAPFVSPLVAGKAFTRDGFRTDTFKPAYIKPKTPISPSDAIKRTMGEAFGGNLSMEQRLQVLTVQALADQLTAIRRREEIMAAEVIRTGKITVVGDQYPSTLVDFSRDAALTVALTGGNRWGQSGIKPTDSLSDWRGLVIAKSGAGGPWLAVMDPLAFKLFRASADVRSNLDNRFVQGNAMELGGINAEGATLMGVIDGFLVVQYQAWYVDPADNTEKQVLPDNTCIVASPGALEGAMHYGAILDLEALQAMPYFPKVWNEQDPSIRFAMTQSAPLPVPHRVNATLVATVN